MSTDWARAYGWGLDFCRALKQRPLWARLLFRLACGKYAYREFIGMQDCFIRDSFDPFYEYGLENVSYHKDSTPVDFSKERSAIPLKPDLQSD